jgi:hypothetical protein
MPLSSAALIGALSAITSAVALILIKIGTVKELERLPKNIQSFIKIMMWTNVGLTAALFSTIKLLMK